MDQIESTNQEGSINSRRKIPVSVVVIIFLQIFVFFTLTYTFAANPGGINPFYIGFFFMLLAVSVVLGVTGLVWVMRLGQIYRTAALLLLATSVFILLDLWPLNLSKKISPIFHPIVEKQRLVSSEQAKQISEYTKKMHYSVLSEVFQHPQTIVEAQYKYLVLEDGNVLKLFGFSSSSENETEFEKYASEFLVGKTIKIDLPDYADFSNNYTPNFRTGIFVNDNYTWPRDPKLQEPYGEIPVLISVNDELINLRYGSERSLQKYLSRDKLVDHCAKKAEELAQRPSVNPDFISRWVVLRSSYNESKQFCFGEFIEHVTVKIADFGPNYSEYWIFNLTTDEVVASYVFEGRSNVEPLKYEEYKKAVEDIFDYLVESK